jgi:pimeloyl-[acyl-carrier protein] synthase
MPAQVPTLNPRFDTDEFQNNIHDHYRDLIKNTPVFRNDEGVVYVTRYEDCFKLLGGKQFKRNTPQGIGLVSKPDRETSLMEQTVSRWMLLMDQPRHDVVRKAFTLPFMPKAVEALEPFIIKRSQELLRKISLQGEVELLKNFSYQLPVMVIAEILGVPPDDMDLFYQWSAKLTAAIDSYTHEGMQTGTEVIKQMIEYFDGLLARAETLPPHSLIRMLHNDPMQLTAAELNSGLIFLLWSGHETTKNLISSGLQLLAERPAVLKELKEGPELITSAIEEMLRFDSPVQKVSRWVHEDAVFGGFTIPSGTMITALVGAAHQDATAFSDPETFNIHRQENRHIAFGIGLHRCMGSTLARLEAQVAFNAFLPLIKELRPVRHHWRTLSAFRSLDELVVEIKPV